MFAKDDSVARWSEKIKGQISALRDAPNALRKNKALILQLMATSKRALAFAHDELKADETFILQIIDQFGDGSIMEPISTALKNRKKVILSAVKKNTDAFKFASDKLKNNKKFVLQLIEHLEKGYITQYISTALQDDEDVILASVKKNPEAFKCASDKLKNNKKFVLGLIESLEKGDITQYISTDLQDDQDVILASVTKNPDAFLASAKSTFRLPAGFASAPDRIKNDKNFILQALKQPKNSSILEYTSTKFRDDEDIVFAAVIGRRSAFEFASDRLKNDKDFVLKLIAHLDIGFYFGRPITSYISSLLRKDEDVIFAAVKNDPKKAFEFASDRLKNDKNFVLRCINSLNSLSFIEHISSSLKDSEEVILAAAKKDANAAQFASDRLQDDNLLWLECVIKRGYPLSHIPRKYQYDRVFVLKSMITNPKDTIRLLSEDRNSPSPFLKDKEIMLTAIAQDSALFEYSDQTLKSDIGFMQEVAALELKTAHRGSKAIMHHELETNFGQLGLSSYQEPTETELELLAQIKSGARQGRMPLPLVSKNIAETTVTPNATYDSFSSTEALLTPSLQKHFSHDLALFEYSIFFPEASEIKGVIIHYYGGFGGYNFRSGSTSSGDSTKKFIENGYIVINFLSHDNWQMLHQSKQSQPNNPAGIRLLNNTLIQLLLFASAIKARFQIPLIYFGASFGGYKGALVNLLLSNKDSIDKWDDRDLFADLRSVLNDTDSEVFDAYVLHDAAFHYFSDLGVQWPNPMKHPALILQNFDDERVSVDQALTFIDSQMSQNLPFQKTILHVSPQGSKSAIQKPDDGQASSLEGHFSPKPEKYYKEYFKALFAFLDHLNPTESAQKSQNLTLLHLRHQHTKTLFCADTGTQTKLYRLYYALLHLDEHASNQPMLSSEHKMLPMTKRLQACFSLLAYEDVRTNKQEAYHALVNGYGPWLIAAVLKKRHATFMHLMHREKNSYAAARLFPLAEDKKITSQVGEKQPDPFTLSQDALDYLTTQDKPLDLIKRCSPFAVQIVDILPALKCEDSYGAQATCA